VQENKFTQQKYSTESQKQIGDFIHFGSISTLPILSFLIKDHACKLDRAGCSL